MPEAAAIANVAAAMAMPAWACLERRVSASLRITEMNGRDGAEFAPQLDDRTGRRRRKRTRLGSNRRTRAKRSADTDGNSDRRAARWTTAPTRPTAATIGTAPAPALRRTLA